MSLLDDENILIRGVKESCNFSNMLDSVLDDFKTTKSIHTKSGEDLFKILPCFENYEWTRYCNRFTMYHTTSRSVVLDIHFDEVLLYYSSKYKCEYMVHIVIYSNYYYADIRDSFNSLFKLDDGLLWECKYIEGYECLKTESHTIYKKKQTQLK